MTVSITIASPISFGMHHCRCACNGHNRAMMKSLSANGVRTELAAQVAARIAITAIVKTSRWTRDQLPSKPANEEALRSGRLVSQVSLLPQVNTCHEALWGFYLIPKLLGFRQHGCCAAWLRSTTQGQVQADTNIGQTLLGVPP
jgi:hypothetical protein